MTKPAEAGFVFTLVLNRQLDEQLVQAAHIGGRVFNAFASGQPGLAEEDVRKAAKAGLPLLVVGFLDQRVGWVEFKDWLRIRHLLPAGFEDLAHLQAKVLFANGENGWGGGP